MDFKIRDIITEIAEEKNIKTAKVEKAVNHFFNWQRAAFKEDPHVSFRWKNAGSFNAIPQRCFQRATNVSEFWFKRKKRKKYKEDPNKENKEKLIDTIITYNPKDVYVNFPEYKSLIIRNRKKTSIGFWYENIFQMELVEIQDLLDKLNNCKQCQKEKEKGEIQKSDQ